VCGFAAHIKKSVRFIFRIGYKQNLEPDVMTPIVDIPPRQRESRRLVILLGAAFLFYIIFILRTAFSIHGETYFTLVDDAMISMRYARNLADGYGLVWNPGLPSVQGFTNPAWTFYMALLHLPGLPESKISLAVMFTSALLLLGNALLSYRLVRVIAPRLGMAPLIAAAVTAFYFPLVFWSLRGMELSLACLLVYLSALIAIHPGQAPDARRSLWIGLVLFLALLVRLDTLPQVSLVLVYLLYTCFRQKARLLPLLPAFLLPLIGVLGTLFFQYRYYGSALPNTYYLKVVGASLAERVVLGLKVLLRYSERDFITPFLFVLAGFIFIPAMRRKASFLLLSLFLVQCAYSVYVGGDFTEPLKAPLVEAANRFITQGMPSIIILFAIVIDHLLQALKVRPDAQHAWRLRSPGILASGISLAVLVIMSGLPWARWTVDNAPMLNSDILRARLGVHIRENTDPMAVIAVHAAGQIPYYSHRQTVDLLGINDPVIARGPAAATFRPGHNKWNYPYSIGLLKPDLLADEWSESNAYMATQPDFTRLANGIWVRKDSQHVDPQGLAQPYR
jgi:hypothetical protein